MKGRLLDAVPLSSLTGVGAALSNKLAKINLHTVQDLLLHLPLRYEDRTHLYPIGELLPGVYATVEGEVLNCNISFGGRRMMTCQISDGSGILTMRFFNFNAAMKNSLATGRRVLAYGEAKRGKYGAEMIHPEYRVQGDLSTPELQETLTPVYPTTEGVKQATLRKLTDQALDLLDTCAIEELLPPELSQGMMTLPEALRLAADLAEQKMQLENQLAIVAPKVEFADRVGEASGILIGNFAKVVGIGQNKLFAWMRDHKILIASGSRRNVPMQEYMDRGYFTVKETAVNTNHGIQISFTTKITGRGQQWLTRKLLDNGMLKVTGEAA